jgi:hypothetical protein
MRSPHHARRAVLESLALDEGHCVTPDTFDDGHALYQAACEQGLDVRTGNRTRIACCADSLDLAPNGRTIAFSKDGITYRMNIDGTARKRRRGLRP